MLFRNSHEMSILDRCVNRVGIVWQLIHEFFLFDKNYYL